MYTNKFVKTYIIQPTLNKIKYKSENRKLATHSILKVNILDRLSITGILKAEKQIHN